MNTDISFNRNKLIGIFLRKNNLSNTLSISDFDKHFYFEDPIDISEINVNYNTKVHCFAKVSSIFIGRKTLKYNRLNLADLPNLEINIDSEQTLYELLPKINSKYGLFLTTYDVYDEYLEIGQSNPVNVFLIFKPTSLVFNNSIEVPIILSGGNASTVFNPNDIAGGGGAIVTE